MYLIYITKKTKFFLTLYFMADGSDVKNIAKGTTDPRVEFISQVVKQIWIKFQFQNLD